MSDIWELYAVKYAALPGRLSSENFIGEDPHDNAPMPLDYFVWAAVCDGRAIVIDTGFETREATRRGRNLLRSVTDGLGTIGVAAAQVEDVIVTHLHYDHIGGYEEFPAARFHVQEREMQFATGPHMCSATLNKSFTADHIAGMVHRVFDGRVAFYDGAAEIAPGITVHRVGGHSLGLQIVRVKTRRGYVVVASDATHFYDNMDMGLAYPVVVDMREVVQGWQIVRDLADSPGHIVPGHDPLVTARYPALNKATAGIAMRLDADPAA